MRSLRRVHFVLAFFVGATGFLPSHVYAIPEEQIRKLVKVAEDFERQSDWDNARDIYERLLKQNDPGLNIRDRYYHVLRRSWQIRRHQDLSYRKEVLSVDYGQAIRLCGIINNTLLDGSFEKKKIDSEKLLRKGLEELDSALADRQFLQQYIPTGKHDIEVPAFRALLKKAMSEVGPMSRKEAMKKIGEVALLAERVLDLDPTVAVMEFACGACYAIDEYTVYLTPNQLRELAQSLSQYESTSVGLFLRIQDNKIVVRDLAIGSPASISQEVFKDDEIVGIDKQPVVNLTLDTVKKMLDGATGTMVEIELRSPGEDMTRSLTLTRQPAVASVISFPQVQTPYWYLKVTSFADATPVQIDKAIQQMTANGAKGLILDLRQNNGGIVDGSIEAARRFLTTGVIASSVNQDTKQNQVYHARNPNALTIPMTVLVDNDTASAAEVLAGALKENNRATLIGQTTFGKGCTQCVLKLPNATGGIPTGGMRLTIARMFSPKGMPYSGRGVVPHIFIDDRMAASQANMNADPFIDRAVEELNRMLSMPK